MNKKEKPVWISVLKLISNIISWTLLTLLILVAGFLLYYVISTQIYAVKGEEYAPKFSLYTIISPSMTPNINVYDIVIDKKIDNNTELKVGDVITFISTSSISNGMTITHRIVDVIETDEGVKYKTKGDANLTADYALVTRDKIIGKVKLRLPQLGRVQFFLSSKGGWLFIILIPAIIIIFLDILKLLKVVNIKQKVNKVEKESIEDENISQAELVEEHQKQQELKKKLQSKANQLKFRRSKYESSDFLDDIKPVIIKVERTSTLSENDEIELNGLMEINNKLINESIVHNMENEEYVSDYIVSDIKEKNNNSTFKEFLKNNKEENYNKKDDNKLTSKNQENIDEDEIFDKPSYSEIREKLASMDEDEEIDLPKKIELKEQEIPEDLDMPSFK